MGYSAFQNNGFQRNAFQIQGSGAVSNGWLGGGDLPDRKKKYTRYETASELIDRLVDTFTKAPEEQVIEAKEVITELKALSIPEIPVPDFTLTYEQILEIQRIITAELIRFYQQREEDEFLILAAALLL